MTSAGSKGSLYINAFPIFCNIGSWEIIAVPVRINIVKDMKIIFFFNLALVIIKESFKLISFRTIIGVF